MKNDVKMILGDCLIAMKELPENSIDLVITSPPYFNLKEYAQWSKYEDYLLDMAKCFKELKRILKQGRHICWNIQDNLPNPSRNFGRRYYALMPDTIKIAQGFNFEWERNIIWNKNNATQLMMGSYPQPPNMIYSCVTESICIFRKPGKTDLSNKTEASKVPQKEWNVYKSNLWHMHPETRSSHPAPFPVELPSRLIKMHSFIGDIVADPYMGSGTTGVACALLKRGFWGVEKKKEYLKNAETRVFEAQNQLF